MAAEHGETTFSLEEALADLRRIRETVDRSRDDHPIRLVGRPLMTLSAVIGVLILVYGIAAQLVLTGLPGGVAGLAASTVIWILSALLLTAATFAKVGVMAAASRRAGFDANKLVRSVVNMDYARVLVPLYLLTAVAAVGLVMGGRADMLPGLITVACGAAYLAIPAILPLGELTRFGVVYFVLGCVAMFVLPEWPFYKVALVLGLPMVIGGLIGRRGFPEVREDLPRAVRAGQGAAVDQG